MRKQQWCRKHWGEARKAIAEGTHIGIAFAMALPQVWIEKRGGEPGFPKPHQASRLNRLLDADSPICCWLGEDGLREVWEKAKSPRIEFQ